MSNSSAAADDRIESQAPLAGSNSACEEICMCRAKEGHLFGDERNDHENNVNDEFIDKSTDVSQGGKSITGNHNYTFAVRSCSPTVTAYLDGQGRNEDLDEKPEVFLPLAKDRPETEDDKVLPSLRDAATALTQPDHRAGSMTDLETAKLCSWCDNASTRAEGHCQECAQDLCSACIHRHGRMRMAADHNIVLCPTSVCDDEAEVDSLVSGVVQFQQQQEHRLLHRTSTMDGIDRCRKHKEEKLRFFCKTCQQPVCRDCVLTAHKHHDTEDIGEATQSARSDLTSMMRKLQQKCHLLESYLSEINDYKTHFLHQTQQVQERLKAFHCEVKAAVDTAYKQLTDQLQRLKEAEEERVQKLSVVVHNHIEDVSRILRQQAVETSSSIFVLSQHEIVSLALKTLEYNMQQMLCGDSEFIISQNPHLKNILESKDILGTLAFNFNSSTRDDKSVSPGNQQSIKKKSNIARTLITELSLQREMSFNIWQLSGFKNSILSIVETSSETVWVATLHSLLRVAGVSKDSVSVSEEIVGLAAGPGDKLLVSLGSGNIVKLYSGGNNWATFASIPKGSTIIASCLNDNSLKVYVAVSSAVLASTKVLMYSTDGQVCQQLKLPKEIFDMIPKDKVPQQSMTSSPFFPSNHHANLSGLSLSCMAIGNEGELLLGTLAGEGQVLVVDAKGQLIGQYKGQDGTGCWPVSLCAVGRGKMVVADRRHCAVELVDLHGQSLATLLSRQYFLQGSSPTAVIVDSNDRLWVGTSMGHICAYKFLHTFD